MRTFLTLVLAALCCVSIHAQNAATRKEPVKMNLWPGLAPGETTSNPGRVLEEPKHIVPIGDVTAPELFVYPLPGKQRRPAVLVCPGGGYYLLASDLEGSEIAAWLNSLGYAAAVLHYRVPNKREGALQDVQRAMSILRARAQEWSIDPHRLGALGFSAGANLCARLAAGAAHRAYDRVDAIDDASCRPDFLLLIYPAYLMDGPDHTVAEDVAPNPDMPPVFQIQTKDDQVLCAPGYARALDAVGIPNTLVLYDRGGHGYGLRAPADQPVHAWPDEAAAFLKWVTIAPPRTAALYPGKAPDARGDGPEDTPTYTVYPTARGKGTGAAMVVCPGGGYHALMMSYEGHDIARWLTAHGVTAVVLKYRVAPYPPAVSIADGKRAVRTLRYRAKELGIDPKRIGMIGFSAGGHLASSVGTDFDAGNRRAADPVERRSCRPDFLALVYPSTTIGGGTPTDERVTRDTPPTWLVHARTDQIVPVAESERFYAALKKAGVAAEFLELPNGAHGLGCGTGDLWAQWQAKCIEWLVARGLATP